MDIRFPFTLKRSSSAPLINNLLSINKSMNSAQTSSRETPQHTTIQPASPSNHSPRPHSPQSPTFNIFAQRTRRYSTTSYYGSFVNGGAGGGGGGGAAVTGLSNQAQTTIVGGVAGCNNNSGQPSLVIPSRVSQLRQEECSENREVNHEREMLSAMQMSQSCEDLSLDAESSWSFKSSMDNDNGIGCNPNNILTPPNIGIGQQLLNSPIHTSPSPTNTRTPMLRLPHLLSPSPTRRTFQTRRSMSPVLVRPSTLGPVKRKCELDDNNSSSQPFKKMFTDNSRGSSPICQSPLLTCPSPESLSGRTTPKFYFSKLCSSNTNSSSSAASSPSAVPSPSQMEIQIDLPNVIIDPIMIDKLTTDHDHCNADDDDDGDGDDVDENDDITIQMANDNATTINCDNKKPNSLLMNNKINRNVVDDDLINIKKCHQQQQQQQQESQQQHKHFHNNPENIHRSSSIDDDRGNDNVNFKNYIQSKSNFHNQNTIVNNSFNHSSFITTNPFSNKFVDNFHADKLDKEIQINSTKILIDDDADDDDDDDDDDENKINERMNVSGEGEVEVETEVESMDKKNNAKNVFSNNNSNNFSINISNLDDNNKNVTETIITTTTTTPHQEMTIDKTINGIINSELLIDESITTTTELEMNIDNNNANSKTSSTNNNICTDIIVPPNDNNNSNKLITIIDDLTPTIKNDNDDL